MTALLFTARLAAQPGSTNNPPATNAPAVIEITSQDGFEYDLVGGQATYRGNVVVKDVQMNINCQTLRVKFQARNTPAAAATNSVPMISGQLGGKVESIHAEGGVVILNRQDGSQAHGELAVYTAATESVVLTGNRPFLRSGPNRITADRIIFDRAKGKFSAEGRIESEFDQALIPGKGLFNTTPMLRREP